LLICGHENAMARRVVTAALRLAKAHRRNDAILLLNQSLLGRRALGRRVPPNPLSTTPAVEKTPVLAIAAHDDDSATIDALKRELFGRRGVEMVLRKPLDIDALFTAIQQYCPLQYTPWRGSGRKSG
jgi:CheY-like chemotaxis protein